VQGDETAVDDVQPAPQTPRESFETRREEECPREHGIVITVAEDGTATAKMVSGTSILLPQGGWEVGDAVMCVTRAGTRVWAPE
jgi:hypothetical protein